MTCVPPVRLVNGIAAGPPPIELPSTVQSLLASILGVGLFLEVIGNLWAELQLFIWDIPTAEVHPTEAEITKYNDHGRRFRIGIPATLGVEIIL